MDSVEAGDADAATRHQSHQLHAGEALDWWRVEHIDRPHLLRLRADVPLPGRLWLELSVHDDGDEALLLSAAGAVSAVWPCR